MKYVTETARFPGPALPMFPHVVYAALRRITWRVAALTLTISLAFDVWSLFDAWRGESAYQGYISGIVLNTLMAFSLLLATFVADEFIARGARRLPAYTCAVVAGSVLAATLHWLLHPWLPSARDWAEPLLPPAALGLRISLEYLLWGSIGVSIYAHSRAALQAAQRLRDAQIRAARSRRRALESRLQALQTRVDPSFLSATLLRIRDAYDRGAVDGVPALDGLIAYLRASLQHPEEPHLTLERELRRLQAYFAICVRPLRLSIHAAPLAMGAHVPAMLLQPLLECIASRPSAAFIAGVDIAADVTAETLRIVISAGRGPRERHLDANSLEKLTRRLGSLYAERAALTELSKGGTETRLVVQIPYETADRVNC
ncbi:MAG TPA: histidine kinase [Steroidobacteraceae bacterium]|nr:histidine kinase [Steroidobacteraceae bacterium]